jgi:hypothetical protein
MWRSVSFILIITLSISRVEAQDNTPDLIVTCKAHQAWMDSLRQAPLAQQIQMVKNRVVSDTGVYLGNTKLMLNREQGCCKPLFILSGYLVKFKEGNPGPDLQRFMTVYSQIKVDTIFVVRSEDLSRLYGQQATGCGAVIINTKDKQSESIIKQAYKHQR